MKLFFKRFWFIYYLRLEEEEKEEAVKEKNEKVKLMKRMEKEIEKKAEEDSSIQPTAPLMGNIQNIKHTEKKFKR